jgi:dipeptidyl aminopeptidase/acylaminoacyl peptidase
MCVAAIADEGVAPSLNALPVDKRSPKIPAAVFASQAAYYDLNLSPKGDRILATSTENTRETIVIHDLATGKGAILPLPENAELVWHRWAGERRILLSLGWTIPWFGSDVFATRLFVFDLNDNRLNPIGPRNGAPNGDDVLYVDSSGDWLLLALSKSLTEYPAVYRVDLSTSKMEVMVKSQENVWDWYADTTGTVRAGIGFLNRSWFMIYRKSADEKFRKLGSARYDDDKAALDIVRLARGSDEGYVLSNEKTGRYALYRFNFATQALGDLVFESSTNDVDDFALDTSGSSVWAVRYTDDRERVVWFDPLMKKYQESIEAAFPGKVVRIESRDTGYDRFVIWVGSPNDPGAYYVYAPGSGQLKRIAEVNDRLDPKQLSETRYTHYRARDGLEIPAYLTLPVGREAARLPLIIIPHGGPYGVRDAFQYEPEAQFLANRGYAVLQPNYRGSPSYGLEFYKKGEGQWGRAMQDDLDDGMDWLVREGIVDAGRVCIVGSSYGGYAALWGATRNPERYRCAASLAGISDVRQQLKYQVNLLTSRYRKDWRHTVQGDAGFDLDSISPLKQIDRLKVPVLIAHGDADKRVPLKQSSLYASALAKAGKTHEFYAYAGEGHGFADPANFANWLERLEAFLTKYNPAN